MFPEAVRSRPAYQKFVTTPLERLLVRYRLHRLGVGRHFDLSFKRRFMAGERFSTDEIEEKYDRTWQKFVDDCVTGDDLETIIAHLDADSRTVLEVGCGAGRVAREVARTGRRVTGVDISGEALKLARAAAERDRLDIEWVKAPVEHLPFADSSFDVVLTAHTLEHVQDLDAAVAELRRVAARQLIVIVPREDRLNELSTDYHFQCFPTAEALERAIGLPDATCFVARTHNEQWQGEYVFFAGRLAD